MAKSAGTADGELTHTAARATLHRPIHFFFSSLPKNDMSSGKDTSLTLELQKSAARIKMKIDHVIQNTTFWKTWLGGSLGVHLALVIIQFILTQTQDDLKPITPYFTHNYRIVMLGLNFTLPYLVLLLMLLFTNLSGKIGFVFASSATISSAVACGVMAIAQVALVVTTLVTFYSCNTSVSSGPCPINYGAYWFEFGVELAQVASLIAATVSLSFLQVAFSRLNTHLVRKLLNAAHKKVAGAGQAAALAFSKARGGKQQQQQPAYAQAQASAEELKQSASSANPRAVVAKQAKKFGLPVDEVEVSQHGFEIIAQKAGVNPADLREDQETVSKLQQVNASLNASGSHVVDSSQVDFTDAFTNARKRKF